MKKRRTLIVGLLLVAALALGIGYAGFTSDLSVNGEAIINGVSESQVLITSIELVTDQSTAGIQAVADCGTNGTKAATVDVTGFDAENEYAVIRVTVTNPHQFAVNMTDPVLTPGATNKVNGEDYYFSYDIIDEDNIPDSIAKEGPWTFDVKITCLNVTPDSYTSNFSIAFTASTRT